MLSYPDPNSHPDSIARPVTGRMLTVQQPLDISVLSTACGEGQHPTDQAPPPGLRVRCPLFGNAQRTDLGPVTRKKQAAGRTGKRPAAGAT